MVMEKEREREQDNAMNCPYHPHVPVIPYQETGRWCKKLR